MASAAPNNGPPAASPSGKRQDYISWEEYKMGSCFLAALRSKDPNTQVGACIFNKHNVLVGSGYNGFPRGCHDDEFSWHKRSDVNEDDNKDYYVCHAEMNAIINKNMADLTDCTIYTVLFPCHQCAKFIIQANIKKVVYYSDKKSQQWSYVASKKMFEKANVECCYLLKNHENSNASSFSRFLCRFFMMILIETT